MDNVMSTIKQSASRTREKYRKEQNQDESKAVKKLQASNPIAALVSALSCEFLVQFAFSFTIHEQLAGTFLG